MIVADFHDIYKLTKHDEVSKTYSFLKLHVSYRKPRVVSDEQREWARQMMVAKNRIKEVIAKFNGIVCALVVR